VLIDGQVGVSGVTGVRTDTDFMRRALELAGRAEALGEVPVGALVVQGERIIGEGWNQPITLKDPTAHAEILALRAAAAELGDYRLGGTTLYVTLEPCPMCAAALVHARVARLVYGAWDPRQGAAGSAFNLVTSRELNHRIDCFGGVLADECGAALKRFFSSRR
jgi:tRNA(adenine34) deaminase